MKIIFLSIKINEDNDRKGKDYRTLLYAGEEYDINMNKNLKSWLIQWQQFNQKYPNFMLKGTIKDFCNAYNEQREILKDEQLLLLDNLK